MHRPEFTKKSMQNNDGNAQQL